MPLLISVKILVPYLITWTSQSHNACFVKIRARLVSIRLESVGLVKIIYYYSKMVVSRNALDPGLQILVPKNAYNACRLVRHAYL